MRSKRFLLFLIVLFFSTAFFTDLVLKQTSRKTAAVDEAATATSILVKWKDNCDPTSEEVRKAVHQEEGFSTKVTKLRLCQWEQVEVGSGNALAAIQNYSDESGVEKVEINYKARPFPFVWNGGSGGVPAPDPDPPGTTDLPNPPTTDPFLSLQDYAYKIQAANNIGEGGWHVNAGARSSIIAILDSGIDLGAGGDHQDLGAKKVIADLDFTTGQTIPSTTNTSDSYGHGTNVAGIAGAVPKNNEGIVGIGYNSTLVNEKVMDSSGFAQYSWLGNAIAWAADEGAKVINMSLGGTSYSSFLEEAVNYAWSKNVVLVAAAGNDGVNTPTYPASYTNVIAVGATDTSSDQKAYFSNWGTWVDIAAPGINIYTTSNSTNPYVYVSGTSAAAPQVAGTAARVWATGKCNTNICVRRAVEQQSDVVPGTGTHWVYGRLNDYKAVKNVTPETPQTPTPTQTLTSSTLAPLHDSYVDSVSPSSNYGTGTSLKVKGAYNTTYLKFYVGLGTIQSAKLRLYVNDTGDPASIKFITNNYSWTESTVTYNNRPAVSSSTLATLSDASTIGMKEVTLPASTIQAETQAQGGYLSLAITNASASLYFNSDEASSNKPQLVLNGGTVSQPTPTPASATNTPTKTKTPTPGGASPTKTPTKTPTPISSAYDLTLNPVADSYVYESSSSTNYGGNVELVSNDPSSNEKIAYLKFDLSPAAGRTIITAKLKLYVTSSSPAQTLKRVSYTSWAENTITWNNKPTLGTTTIGSFSPSSSGTSYEVALTTSDVQSAVGGLYSIAIKAGTTTDDRGAFSSKEASTTSNRPKLLIDY